MKSLRGRIFYCVIWKRVFFVPAARGNNGSAVKEIIDLTKKSPTFGVRVSVGDVLLVKKHHEWAEGTEVTITRIRFFDSSVIIEGKVPGEKGEHGFNFSDFSLPSIF